MGFNSRPRVAGDPDFVSAPVREEGFNSRPRVAGDLLAAHPPQPGVVSIHARAWRATGKRIGFGKGLLVSIHARAWRATRHSGTFFPTRLVSIHARAWRATLADRRLRAAELFQFTPARGGRHDDRQRRMRWTRFNSRPRVAGDAHCR